MMNTQKALEYLEAYVHGGDEAGTGALSVLRSALSGAPGWVFVTERGEKPEGLGACVVFLDQGIGLALAYHTGSHWRWFNNNEVMLKTPVRFLELPPAFQ